MPEFYTCVILLLNQLDEIGEKRLSVYGLRGGQICPLMHACGSDFRLYNGSDLKTYLLMRW